MSFLLTRMYFMKKIILPISSFFIFFFLIQSCKKDDNNGIPAYIQIENVSLLTDANQGSNSHFINTLWIESEGENLGVFEFPNTIPALVNGDNRQIIINAGVFIRGDYFNREIYQAYQPYKADIDFTIGDTTVVNPVFEYYETTLFPFIEDFENGNAFSGLPRTISTDTNNLEGKAMIIQVDASNELVRGTTNNVIVIPDGRSVYIEFDFKSDIDFAIGVESLVSGSIDQTGYIDRFFAQKDWYKIYYNISDLVNGLNGESYRFFFEVDKLDDVDESTLYVDNFKIVVI